VDSSVAARARALRCIEYHSVDDTGGPCFISALTSCRVPRPGQTSIDGNRVLELKPRTKCSFRGLFRISYSLDFLIMARLHGEEIRKKAGAFLSDTLSHEKLVYPLYKPTWKKSTQPRKPRNLERCRTRNTRIHMMHRKAPPIPDISPRFYRS
jgi:hypothetical protein